MGDAIRTPSAEESAAYLRGFYDGCAVVRQITVAAVRYVRAHYDENIFPPPKEGKPRTKDNESAEVARLTCDNVARTFIEFYDDPPDLSSDATDNDATKETG